MEKLTVSRFKRHVRFDRNVPDISAAFARAVENAVERRLLPKGASLPAASELAEAYEVGPATVRSGLLDLVRRSVLESRPGPRGGYWIAGREVSLVQLTTDFVARARAGGNGDEAIAAAVAEQFPQLLSIRPRSPDRAARRYFGKFRAEATDIAENHDRYLDEG